MESCADCARRATCRRLCPAIARQLPSMRKGEMAVRDIAMLDRLPAPERSPGAGRALFFQRFLRLWQRLSPRQREVIVLLYVKGFSEPRAACRLGISQPMVVKHHRRALRKITAQGGYRKP